MPIHISEELMAACYDVIANCKDAIFNCKDLETCERTGTQPCQDTPRAVGACELVIKSCKNLMKLGQIHLAQCNLDECKKRVKNCMAVCDTAVTMCDACINACMKETQNCAHFSQKSSRTCEDVIVAAQKIIDHI